MTSEAVAPPDEPQPDAKQGGLHPLLVMLCLVLVACVLTHVMQSGRFERQGGKVVAGSYLPLEKAVGIRAALAPMPQAPLAAEDAHAYPASIASAAVAIPSGMVRSAALIAMVLFGGGMFGVLQKTGALDAAIGTLISRSRGRVVVVAASLMTAVALGSSLLGLMSEYLAILVMVRALLARLGLTPLFATASVVLAAKVGFMASVTNPLPLLIAQPLMGLPLTSGIGMRLSVLALFLPLAIAYLLWAERSHFGRTLPEHQLHATHPLAWRQRGVLGLLVVSLALLVAGATRWHWGYAQIAAFYGVTGIGIAMLGGLSSRESGDAFVRGTQNMVLPALLIGMAKAIEGVLADSRVLDRAILDLSTLATGATPYGAALGIGLAVALLGFLVPSTSGKAALCLPILAPVGQLAGVPADSVVLAFLLGNGLTNLISPTSGLLLAFLATGGIRYGQWLRFVAPLYAVLTALSCAMVVMSVALAH